MHETKQTMVGSVEDNRLGAIRKSCIYSYTCNINSPIREFYCNNELTCCYHKIKLIYKGFQISFLSSVSVQKNITELKLEFKIIVVIAS